MVELHGKAPYKTVLIHGGPGAVGSLKTCSEELSRLTEKGIVEALQSQYSIAELIEELYLQIIEYCQEKPTLIGHSWGAWLAVLFAEKYPKLCKNIILVGCPPLADKYVKEISLRRLRNLSGEESKIFQRMIDNVATDEDIKKIPSILEKSDNYYLESSEKLIVDKADNEMYIIVITGDLIDAGHTDIEIAFDFIKQAVQIAPVYFVTGNHEANFSHYDQFKTGLEASGVTVLEDEAIQLVHNNEMITLIGLSDSDFTIKGDMFNEAPAMVNTKLNSLIDDENSYTILLSHRPELFETYVCCGVDLVLCGHAHGGQFRLPFIGGLVAPNQGLFPKYDSGLYTDGKTNMVVSRGLGNSIIPFRFNNRPEVVLVELNTE